MCPAGRLVSVPCVWPASLPLRFVQHPHCWSCSFSVLPLPTLVRRSSNEIVLGVRSLLHFLFNDAASLGF